MKVKEFIKNFNPENPDWSGLPEGFPDCKLKDLTSSEIGKFSVIKTLWEMSQPERPKARSRVWEDPCLIVIPSEIEGSSEDASPSVQGNAVRLRRT